MKNHKIFIKIMTIFLSACGSVGQFDVREQPSISKVENISSATGAKLLFKSGFEGDTRLGAYDFFGNGAWQSVSGKDHKSGFSWPLRLYGGTSRFQLIAGDNVSISSADELRSYMLNSIKSVTRSGKDTKALYSVVKKSINGQDQNWDSTQNVFQIWPGENQGDIFVRYRLKLQPDLLERMTVNNWAGRVVTDWKTAGDYRFLLSIYGDGGNRRLYWNMKLDNVANGGLTPEIFWEKNNTTVAVPVGKWFRLEMFVHRSSGTDGRIWVAVDGQRLFDRQGPNMGIKNLPWNRIMPFLNYSSGQQLPAYQWVDDLEIWNGQP
jgi:hypothetical protein